MWQIIQHDAADDFVLATGESHSVREFVELAFSYVGRTIEWRGANKYETGHDADTGQELVAIDPRYFRPTEVEHLIGDFSKAEKALNWSPTVRFDDLVKEMVEHDMKLVQQG